MRTNIKNKGMLLTLVLALILCVILLSTSIDSDATQPVYAQGDGAIEVTRDMLSDNGAWVDSSGSVRYDVNNKSNGTAIEKRDTGFEGNNQWSYFPTKFFKAPDYGTYDFSTLFQSSITGNGNGQWNNDPYNRLFGYERRGTTHLYPNTSEGISAAGLGHVQSTWNDTNNGKGIYLHKPSGPFVHFNVMIYFNIALPDMAVSDGNASMQLTMDVKGWGDNKDGWYDRLESALSIFAVNGNNDTGINAPFTASDNPGINSIGLNHNVNWVQNNTNGLEDNVVMAGAERKYNHEITRFNGVGGDAVNVKVNTGEVSIPTGTRYLRVAIVFENDKDKDGTYSTDRDLQFLLSNLKIKLWDKTSYNSNRLIFQDGNDRNGNNNFDVTTNANAGMLTNSHGAQYTILSNNDGSNHNNFNATSSWTNVKYLDIFFNTVNGSLTKKRAFDRNNGFKFTYINPRTEKEEIIAFGDMKVLGVDTITDNDLIYIVEDKLPYNSSWGVKTYYADLDGGRNMYAGGVNMRVALKVGQIKLTHDSVTIKPNGTNVNAKFAIWNQYIPSGDTFTTFKVDGVAPILSQVSGDKDITITDQKVVRFKVHDSVGNTGVGIKNVMCEGNLLEGQNGVYSISFDKTQSKHLTFEDNMGNIGHDDITAINFIKAGENVTLSLKSLSDRKIGIHVVNDNWQQRIVTPDVNYIVGDVKVISNTGRVADFEVQFMDKFDVSQTINAKNDLFKIDVQLNKNIDGVKSNISTTRYTFLEKVSLVADAEPNAKFVGWYDSNGVLLSQSETFDLVVTVPTTIESRYLLDKGITITYRNASGQVMDIRTYDNGLDVNSILSTQKDVVAPPNAYMQFSHWEIIAGTGTSDIQVMAKYTRDMSREFKVTYTYAGTTSVREMRKNFNDKVTLKGRDASVQGWMLNGVKVSDSDEYTFYVTSDMRFEEISETKTPNEKNASIIVSQVDKNGVRMVTGFLASSIKDYNEIGFLFADGNIVDADYLIESSLTMKVRVRTILNGEFAVNIMGNKFQGKLVKVYVIDSNGVVSYSDKVAL